MSKKEFDFDENKSLEDIEILKKIPLCVKLDKTLISTEYFFECLISMLNSNPLLLFLIPFWFLRGKLFLEKKAFENSELDIRYLPYRKRLVDFIKAEKEIGRETILITNSYVGFAKKMYQYLGIFTDVIASADKKYSYAEIKNILEKKYSNDNSFDYIGSTAEDLQIFEVARLSYLVNPSATLETQARKFSNVEMVFRAKKDKVKIFLQSIHIERWLKNLVIFLPFLLFAKQFSLQNFSNLIYAFFAFSIISSATYLLNNLIDLNLDRQNPLKFNRSVAIGLFSIKASLILIPILIFIGFVFAVQVGSPIFNLILVGYLFFSFAYSTILKKIPYFDLLILALLFVLRFIAGFVVYEIESNAIKIIGASLIAFNYIFLNKYAEQILINKKKSVIVAKYNSNFLFISGIISGLILVVLGINFLINIVAVSANADFSNIILLSLFIPIFVIFEFALWRKARIGKMEKEFTISYLKEPFSYIFLVFFIIFVVLFRIF